MEVTAEFFFGKCNCSECGMTAYNSEWQSNNFANDYSRNYMLHSELYMPNFQL